MREYITLLLLLFTGIVYSQSYTITGTTSVIAKGTYQLTNDEQWQLGTVWCNERIDLRKRFDIEFLLNLGSNDRGADGVLFTLQTSGNRYLGVKTGGNFGFENLIPSLGIEFDTYQNNDSVSAFLGDPSYDHIAVMGNGNIFHNLPLNLAGPVQASAFTPDIEDGKSHLVRITWEPQKKLLEVYFDCTKRVSLAKDISKDIFNGQTEVWWGISGATGGLSNNQTVVLPERIFFEKSYFVCIGKSIELISRVSSDSLYTWYPMNGLSDPAVRNPVVTPEKAEYYTVSYKSFCGMPVTDTVEVAAFPCEVINVHVPDAFTPNNDQVNDIFRPAFIDSKYVDSYLMNIYDRWGNILFSTTDTAQGWDGNLKTEIAMEGTYTFKLVMEFNTPIFSGFQVKTGAFVLMR